MADRREGGAKPRRCLEEQQSKRKEHREHRAQQVRGHRVQAKNGLSDMRPSQCEFVLGHFLLSDLGRSLYFPEP